MHRIIAFHGPAGAGKDACADYIVDRLGYRKLSFANRLKKALAEILNVPVTMMDDRVFKENAPDELGSTVRHMLQTLGTEWGRNTINPDIWLMEANQVLDHMDKGIVPGIVISDLRFENEADWVRVNGGLVVHIKPTGNEEIETKDHSSESGIEMVEGDVILHNNVKSGIGIIHAKLDDLMERFSPPKFDIEPDTIRKLQSEIAEWADSVFPDRTAHHAICKLMLEEIPELMTSNCTDPLEFADVVILILDIAHLQGIDVEKAVRKKMGINRNRKWVTTDNGIMQHEDSEKLRAIPHDL